MAEQKEQKGQKKTGLLKYLDNTISEDGLRTDIKITLTNETLLKIIAAVAISSALGTMIHIMVKGIFSPGNNQMAKQ